MKTLLVLAAEPGFAAAIRALLDPERYRVIAKGEVGEAESLLRQGLVDACLLEAELTDVRPVRLVEQLRRLQPACPVILCSGARPWEWEEAALIAGAAHLLPKPVRADLLNLFLERCWLSPVSPAPAPVVAAAPSSRPSPAPPGETQALRAFRDLSALLTHSLCPEALARQGLLLLREITGVNRAAVFLRRPPGVFAEGPSTTPPRRLHPASAVGVTPGLLEHLELSLEGGIGGFVQRCGRILQRHSDVARADPEIQKEFELLGGDVAIPILDRESLVGVVILDRRVTGDEFPHEELALIFHLLEGLGLAIRNSWLHDQLQANHQVMADILNQSGSAVAVVNRDLSVLHANQAARDTFGHRAGNRTVLEFSDLPQAIGSQVFAALQSGRPVAPFKYRRRPQDETVYQVSVVPFRPQETTPTHAALLLIEDWTQAERSQRLEIEASNLRLVKAMAEHLAHEIGNSLVPLSTHQQLLAKKYEDPEFRASLGAAMAETVQRISRLSKQMLFLARDSVGRAESVPVARLIEEAFQEAQKHHAAPAATLVYDSGGLAPTVLGDRAGLKQAFSEIMLNALQANPPDAPINVRSTTDTEADGSRWVRIEVRDAGPGFPPEAAHRAAEPFFSTRNVGLGLGLAVTRKVIETHRGRIEIGGDVGKAAGIVRVTLPAAPTG
jgi:signal transduction histidine kinase